MLSVGGTLVKEAGKLPFKFADGTYPNYRTYGKEQHEGHVEYYLQDGTQVLDQGMGFALQGQYSLDMPQKSFKLRAKSLYGAKTFAAKLFDDRPSCCAPAATITCSPVWWTASNPGSWTLTVLRSSIRRGIPWSSI